MPDLHIKENGKTRHVAVIDRAGLDEQLRNLGRKIQVSLDGGKTFKQRSKVKEEDKQSFFDLPALTPSRPREENTMAKPKKTTPPKNQLTKQQAETLVDTRVQDAVNEVLDVTKKDLESSINTITTNLKGAFEALDQNLGVLGKQVGEVRESIATHGAQLGQEDGARERIEQILHQIESELANRLSEAHLTKLVENHIGTARSLLEARVSELVTDQTGTLLARVEERHDQMEEHARNIKESTRTIDELIEDEVDQMRWFRPSAFRRLEDRLEQAEKERDEQREQHNQLQNAYDELNRRLFNTELDAGDLAFSGDRIERLLQDHADLRTKNEALVSLELERAQLRSRITQLEELEREWQAEQTLESELTAVNRELQQACTERDRYQRSSDRFEADRNRFERELREQRQANSALNDLLEARSERIVALEAIERDLNSKLQTFTAAQAQFETDQQALITERRAWEATQVQERLDLNKELERTRAARQEALRQTVETEVAAEHHAETELLTAAIDELETELAGLRPLPGQLALYEQALDLAQRNEVEWCARQAELAAQRAALEATIASLTSTQGGLEAAITALEVERDSTRDENTRIANERQNELGELQGKVGEARGQLEKLEQELERRTSEIEVDEKKRRAPLERPVLERKRTSMSNVDEHAWLGDLRERIEDAGFVFPQRLIDAFHTSLKIAEWSPLTVMAGVSGTGKSELARLYSRFGGLNYQLLAVQPNWDSPQDLLGFFNYMDNTYQATDFVRALTQSERSPGEGKGLSDQMLLVLLDEMNLARIELYFSEFNSKLEARRGLDERSSMPTIKVNLGGGFDAEIELGDNVLFAGTMNEDETTQSLSDKILDRGNVISFPRPKALASRDLGKKLDPFDGRLSKDAWRSWIVDPSEYKGAFTEAASSKIRGALDEINDAMRLVDRAIGHRVLQATEAYVANHPKVLRGTSGSDDAWKRAFEDQLMQKLMPKLRGVPTDTKAGKECLERIDTVITNHADGIHADFERARRTPYGSFMLTSAEYLAGGE
jgi:hypothetical protein